MKKYLIPDGQLKESFSFTIKELEMPDILGRCNTPHSIPFISNCLFEAVKAKLRNWNDVKIIYIPKHLNPNKKHPHHFMWINTKLNLCYEFTTLKPINTYRFPLTFMKGTISVMSIEKYNSNMNRLIEFYLHRLEKKLLFKNTILEDAENTIKSSDEHVFNLSKQYVWKPISEKYVWEPLDESYKYENVLISFSEKNPSNDICIYKLTKNKNVIPENVNGKKVFWYANVPCQTEAELKSYLGLTNTNTSILC